MRADPSRRELMAGIGAVAASAALPVRAIAAEASSAQAYRSAGELVKALVDRKVSSRELVDAAIGRIEALDGKINAVVVRDFDRARTAADAADAALAKGQRRPLLGLPMTVKEQFNIAGLPTTWGDPKFKDWKAEVDALAVQRLKAAGAIILGKTNVPINLRDWQSYNEVYGTTNNPWDLSRSPGGSSGGGAAALAAGFVPLEFGSDIGGSLRAPAHFCGVFSHKPSLDLVPQRGAGPPKTPANPVRGDLAVIGPMARSAADLALALDVVAGPDELSEGIGYRLALPSPRHEGLAGFRVLVIDKHPLCPTEASITAALDGLAERLGKSGCTILRESASCCRRFSAPTSRPRRASASRPPPRPCLPMIRASWRNSSAVRQSAIPTGSGRAASAGGCGRAGWHCSRTSTSCSARRCRRLLSRTTIRHNSPASSTSTAPRCRTTIRACGLGPQS